MTKILISFLFLLVFTIVAHAQDVIVKHDGTKIQVKVLEITPTTIRYRNFTQPDGPDRNIEIAQVSEIIYDDGQFEKFDKPAPKPVPTEQKPVKTEEPEKDYLLDHGFGIDLLLGYSAYNRYTEINNIQVPSLMQNMAIGFRMSSKWYFGAGERWRPGLMANWFRLGIHIDPEDMVSLFIGPKTLSPLNVGMTNVFKINENMGFEANIASGYNFEINLDYGYIYSGITLNPEVKFRYKKLAVGLDYMRIFEEAIDHSPDSHDWDWFSASVGVKL